MPRSTVLHVFILVRVAVNENNCLGSDGIQTQAFKHINYMVHAKNDSIHPSYLTPSDPLGQRFTALFKHRWNFVYNEGGGWYTETRYPIQPRTLWDDWKDATKLIGVRFGKFTAYGLIDLDLESIYHPDNDPLALPRLRAALATIGIYRTLLVRSSDSGGLHLYVCLESDVPSFGLALAFRNCLESADFTIAAGQLEIFPNVKSFDANEKTDYNGHRLPLQSGSYLLNDECQVITNDLKHFLNVWELASSGNDLNELDQAIAAAVAANKVISFRSKGKSATQWQSENETTIAQGWTAEGQTNEFIKVIARHGVVFKALSDEALIEYVTDTAINAPGYERFCQHHQDIERRCKDWARAAQRRYTPYCSHPKAGNLWREHRPDQRRSRNIQTASNAIERIRRAVGEVGDRAIATVRELATSIAKYARCSIQTLYKHLSEWHPDHKGCNSHDQPVDELTALNQPTQENTQEKPEPSLGGLLHPNPYKKVLICVTRIFERSGFKKHPLKLPSLPPGFDFRRRRHKKTAWKPLPGRRSRRFRLVYFE